MADSVSIGVRIMDPVLTRGTASGGGVGGSSELRLPVGRPRRTDTIRPSRVIENEKNHHYSGTSVALVLMQIKAGDIVPLHRRGNGGERGGIDDPDKVGGLEPDDAAAP